MCVCVILTLLSSSLAAEKNHVLCFLLKWTILKGNTLLDVVSSAALITLWKSRNVLMCYKISVKAYKQISTMSFNLNEPAFIPVIIRQEFWTYTDDFMSCRATDTCEWHDYVTLHYTCINVLFMRTDSNAANATTCTALGKLALYATNYFTIADVTIEQRSPRRNLV